MVQSEKIVSDVILLVDATANGESYSQDIIKLSMININPSDITSVNVYLSSVIFPQQKGFSQKGTEIFVMDGKL